MSITIYADYIVHPRQTLNVEAAGPEWAFSFDHIDRTDLRFVNAGTVQISSADGYNVLGFTENEYTYGLRDLVWNHGQISVTSTTGSATGFDLSEAVGDFRNEGLFTVTAREGLATGGSLSNEADFDNTGEVRIEGVRALGFHFDYLSTQHNGGLIWVHAGDGEAKGLESQSNDAPLVNDGEIIAISTGGDAIGVQFLYIAKLENAGAISARGFEDAGYQSVGVKFAPSYWQESRIDNSGVIRAGVAIEAVEGFGDPRGATIDNSGKIIGDILLISAPDLVVNSGVIRGDIDLGDGRDVYDGSHGRLIGSVDGGKGIDQLIGGRNGELLVGGAGADILSGGGGGDVFVFRHTADSTAAHSDLILDLQDGDSIDLAAIDADRTTAGDQAFTLVSNLDGHAGQATLHYDAGGDHTLLEADTPGDGSADLVIDFDGDHSIFTSIVL
jgi:hypothetical protein